MKINLDLEKAIKRQIQRQHTHINIPTEKIVEASQKITSFFNLLMAIDKRERTDKSHD